MNYFWVALGGALGSLLRFVVVNFSGGLFPKTTFPVGTLIVNVSGCFIIAYLGGLATDRFTLNASMRFFVFTGILGGFTTFSALGYETFYFLRTTQYGWALINIMANIVLGIGATVFGYLLARYCAV